MLNIGSIVWGVRDMARATAFWTAAEVARLLALGATRPDWRYESDADYVVLTDPDGNKLCVIQKEAQWFQPCSDQH